LTSRRGGRQKKRVLGTERMLQTIYIHDSIMKPTKHCLKKKGEEEVDLKEL
jgi:hypothetical protein